MNTSRFSLLFLSFAASAAVLTAQTTLYIPGVVGPSSNGNVGIGTSSPNFKLEVVNDNYNAIRATGNSSNSVGIYVQNTVSNGRQFALLSSGGLVSPVGSFLIWDDTAGSSRIAISPAGNVGIGTTSPTAALSVRSTGPSSLSLSRSATPNIQFYDDGVTSIGQIYYDANRLMHLGTAGGSDALTLNLGTGNIGIGTTGPAAKLDVAGNAHIGSGTDNMANTPKGLSVQDDSSSPVALAVGRSTGRSAGLVWYDSGATGLAVLYTFGNAAPLTLTAASVSILANNNMCLFAAPSGNVGIGTTTPTHKLSVNGTIRAKEVIVDTGWSDYVFKPDYKLASLSEIEGAIQRDGHLPGIPSAQEVAEHGVSMGEMQAKLLAKIEELTLHQIAQEKRTTAQEKRTAALENENQALRLEIISLRKARD